MPCSVQDYNQHDQRIWDEELADFVPPRVFDAHIHMLNPEHLSEASPAAFKAWSYADLDVLRGWSNRLYPDRQTHFLVLGTPSPGIDVEAHNEWVVGQVRRDPQSRMNRLVTPSCQIDRIRRDLEQPGYIGLKPYRFFSVTGDVDQCRIHDFLPHPQLELANDLGLWVTMHLSQPDGCADQHNLDDLEEFTTRRYPNIKWILAHCARSFTYWAIREAIGRLRELPNIWYDVSAVTDLRPLITLFSQENVQRIFYGSDGVDATYFRGQYAALGRAWQALDMARTELQFRHCHNRPILCIYEQLLSMKQAAQIAGLSQEQIEDIFWNNAVRELGIVESPGSRVESQRGG